MLNALVVCLVLTLCPLLVGAQDTQAPSPPAPAASTDSPVIPASAKDQVNPVKPTADSLAQGKKYYGFDCAMCHGANGNGKGEVAIDEKLKIGDFSDPATLKDKTDGELFYVLKTGTNHMPAERVRAKPDELWNLINYVRSLSKK